MGFSIRKEHEAIRIKPFQQYHPDIR
uniref:UDP-D-galactose:(Glucosyl)lipopolysaccharide-1,6-D-galactosyltransferase n=1 Tax=mine drainage metagenome TaxID=410659 RepID=E6PKR3_9ZZZZ